MTDILTAIDDVLGQQPDLFANVLDVAFGPGGMSAKGFDLTDCVEDVCYTKTVIRSPAGVEYAWVKSLCKDIPRDQAFFGSQWAWSEEINAYLIGLWSTPLPWPVDQVLQAAYGLGRELADQIAWQP